MSLLNDYEKEIEVEYDEERYLVRDNGSFFTLRGALKEYCDYTGDYYDDNIDDYC